MGVVHYGTWITGTMQSAACGVRHIWLEVAYRNGQQVTAPMLSLTQDPAEVTCPGCIENLAHQVEWHVHGQAEFRRQLNDEAARQQHVSPMSKALGVSFDEYVRMHKPK